MPRPQGEWWPRCAPSAPRSSSPICQLAPPNDGPFTRLDLRACPSPKQASITMIAALTAALALAGKVAQDLPALPTPKGSAGELSEGIAAGWATLTSEMAGLQRQESAD
jgi:hypothetical protein